MEASQKSGHRLLTDGKHAGQYMAKYNLYLTPEESDALAARRVQLALVPVSLTPDEAFQQMVELTEELDLYDGPNASEGGLIPRLIILAYRLIPPRVRRLWSFGSSSSHLALADPSWASIRRYALAPAWRILMSDYYSWGHQASLTERGGPSWSDPRDVRL